LGTIGKLATVPGRKKDKLFTKQQERKEKTQTIIINF